MKCFFYSGSWSVCDLVICGWRGKILFRVFINYGFRFYYFRFFSEKLVEERKDNILFELFFIELFFLDLVIEKIDKDLSFYIVEL